MTYEFLVETYETERLKTLGVWSMFRDSDLPARPHPTDRRGRSVHEHMVHQCVSENLWFKNMFGIDLGTPPLPTQETRIEFMRRYAEDSGRRAKILAEKDDAWWSAPVAFFDVARPRAWIMVRRIAHTAHHRGQQTALLRVLGRDLHSTYGPTADTGGLMVNGAPTIYAYRDLDRLLEDAAEGTHKSALPGPGAKPPTERPSTGADPKGDSTRMNDMTELFERSAVTDTVTRLFVETDRKNWSGVAAVLSDAVRFDMTSLAGGSPVTISGQQIADAWRDGLKDIAHVHHQVGNFLVTLRGDRAFVTCHGIATHYRPEQEKHVTTFVGTYDVELARSAGAWKIIGFKFDKKYVE